MKKETQVIELKKVLFLIHDLGQGGAEKVLVNLANQLDKDKYEVTLIALFAGGINEQFLNDSVIYKTIFKRTFRGNSYLFKLFSPNLLHRILVKNEYDIEISYLEGPSARIISGCEGPKTKLVSWIHVTQKSLKSAASAFRSVKESQNCYGRFDKTICVSEDVKENFLSLYPEIKNIEVLYNINDTDSILRMKDESIDEGIFRDGEFKICGIGKIVHRKGFAKLARIHKRLREEGLPVHTYILGSGPEQKEIVQYIESNNLTDSFTFLGYQSNPYKFLAKSDLFVCLSEYEGYSTAATEALIVGTPVISTRVSGAIELLGENNKWGIVTGFDEDDIFNEIRILVNSPEIFEQYKKAAIERGKQLSSKNTVKAVEKMFDELL